ncbi:MAG: hypothetical protein RSD36_09635 [Terrisporobacter sp.]
MGKRKKNKREKMRLKHESAMKEEFINEKLEYCEIISKIEDKEVYLYSYHKYLYKIIDLFDFMEATEDIIEQSNLNDEEINNLNKVLKKKFIDENYTIKKLLFEECVINNKYLSTDDKFNRLQNISKTNSQKSLDYSIDCSTKRIIPEDLKKYDQMNGVKSIIYNAVGTKR